MRANPRTLAPSLWDRFFASPKGRGFRALRVNAFRTIWTTLFVGQLGFWISLISMQTLMARLTGSDAGWLGLLFFTNFAPMLVFTSFAGVMADRYNRKLILVIGFAVIATVMTVLTGLTALELLTPRLMLPFAFAIGTVFAFNAPANQAIVASSVPVTELGSAISLVSVATNLSRVVGPTLAAPVITLTDESVAFALYGIASAVQVVMLTTRITIPPYEQDPPAPFLERLKGGILHARERPPMLAALGVLCMSSLFGAAYLALLPVVADTTFGRGPSGFTTMAAISGLGSMVGALMTGFREAHPTLRRAALLAAGFGGGLALFGLTTNWLAALFLLALVGGLYFSAMTTLNTLIQLLADENKRGRVMALFTIGWGGLVPVGALWQGQVANAIGASRTVGVAGAVTMVFALSVAALSIRDVPIAEAFASRYKSLWRRRV